MTNRSTTPGPALLKRFAFQETARILILLGVAAWLLHPFATSRQVGAGDALWYANMLADFCLQLRAGIFPVFVGQTEFAFNGAVYPLRVAPLYQHLAGAIDLLTGRQIGWFTLQHATVIVCGVAGILSCYFSLCAVAPVRRWQAAAFATLYLSCPGVLGTLYTQDLYMTWMTVPFAPLAVYGIVRTFERDDLTAQVWLAAPLAALWLAHSPIALWFTLIAFATQCIRLLAVHRTGAAWKRTIFGAATFAALGGYPFVSVAALKISGTASAVTAGLAQQERITNVIREVFPAVLLPLSDHARALSDLQLGYALWLVLACSLVAAFWTPRWELRLFLAACALLIALVLPVPGLTDWLWAHLPEQIKRITFYWPMHRFYLLLAALLAVAGQLAVTAGSIERYPTKRRRWFEVVRGFSPHSGVKNPRAEASRYPERSSLLHVMLNKRPRLPRIAVSIGLALACLWSLWESRQFIQAAADRTSSAAESARRQRPENLLLMNHAYGLFAALPERFSNGVVDPRAEVRLLARDTLAPLQSSASHPVATGLFSGTLDANPGILNLKPTLHLAPGKRYELEFEWANHDYRGVLQFVGRDLFREYALPASGERLAFGVGASHRPVISLWSTAPDGDEISVRFIPTAPDAKPIGFTSFARFSFREVAPSTGAIEVASLLPLRVIARTTVDSWLETPRMAVPGYRVIVDGQDAEVVHSPDGLLRVGLTPGAHAVTVTFSGPPSLRVAYWATLAAWIALASRAAATGFRRLRNLSAPAQRQAAAS